MPIKAHQKGASFERAICVRLSLWVSSLQREDLFWRASISGARATQRRKRPELPQFINQSGDISAIDPAGALLLQMFIIECKHYRSLDLDCIAWGGTGGNGRLMHFYEELEVIAEAENRLPMLIGKQNFKPEVVLTNASGSRLLGRGARPRALLEPMLVLPPRGLYLYLLSDILADVDYQRLRQAFKEDGHARAYS